MDDAKKELVQQWLLKALHDLITARVLTHREPVDPRHGDLRSSRREQCRVELRRSTYELLGDQPIGCST